MRGLDKARGLRALSTAALALLLCGASLAAAEEVSRATYKAQAEPICQADTKANEAILSGVRTEVREGKLGPAGAQFAKASTALMKAYRQLQALPQPAADAARLARWLSDVKQEAALFATGARALKAGQKAKAQTVVVKLTHTANLANGQVISFGFRYCKLQPSKFT